MDGIEFPWVADYGLNGQPRLRASSRALKVCKFQGSDPFLVLNYPCAKLEAPVFQLAVHGVFPLALTYFAEGKLHDQLQILLHHNFIRSLVSGCSWLVFTVLVGLMQLPNLGIDAHGGECTRTAARAFKAVPSSVSLWAKSEVIARLVVSCRCAVMDNTY